MIYDTDFQIAALARKQNRTEAELRTLEAELELVISAVAQEEIAVHQEPAVMKPRKSRRKHARKTAERPLRSGEQRITPAQKKSRPSTIQAQTDRSFATFTAAAARLDQPMEQPVDMHAGVRGGCKAVRGAALRGALVRGGKRGGSGANAHQAGADDEDDDV